MLTRVRLSLALLFTASFAAFSPLCHAQAVAIAEVGGTVTDPTGAPIAGAQVRLTETEKQQVRTAVSDAEGRYMLPFSQ